MAKISQLPEVLDPTGDEYVPILKNGIAKRSKLSALAANLSVEAAASRDAAALSAGQAASYAQAAALSGAYAATLSGGVAAYPVNTIFNCDESGSLRRYKRTAGAPGYVDLGKVVAQADVDAKVATATLDGKAAARVEGGQGNGSSLASGGAPAYLSDLADRAADYFAIVPGGADMTARFADMAEWVRTRSRQARRSVSFGPGNYALDKLQLTLEAQGTERGSLSLRGTPGTKLIANVSAEPVFVGIEVASTIGLRIEDISLFGRGTLNPAQDPFALWTRWTSEVGTGELTDGYIKLDDYNFDGSMWFRGSQLPAGLASAGALGNHQPVQHLILDRVFKNSRAYATHRPQLVAIGQFGQINFLNGSYDGYSREGHAGPAIAIGIDWRIQQVQPATEYIATDEWELAGGVELLMPSATAVRVIGTGLPTTSPQLTKGTTYHLHKSALYGAGLTRINRKFKLAVARSDIISGTFVDIQAAGTPASYRFVQLWATALANNEFTTPRAHMLTLGDQLVLTGDNLPAGLTAGTVYFVIRTGHRTFRLAASVTDAVAGTAIACAGGTLSDWGFATYNGNYASYVGLSAPYSINADMLTVQSSEIGLHLANVAGFDLNLHLEALKIGVHALAGSSGRVSGTTTNRGAYTGDGTGTLLLASGSNTVARVDGPVTVDYDSVERIACAIAPAVIDTAEATHSGASGTTARTERTNAQLQAQADGSLDVGGYAGVFVDGNAYTISSIKSRHSAGRRLSLKCHSGSLTFTTAGNISLGGASTLTIQAGTTLEFALHDFGGSWMLLSTPRNVRQYQGAAATAGTYTPAVLAGETTLGAIGSDTTIAAPSDTASLYLGFAWSVWITQDGTGGWKVAWDAASYDATLIAAGPANARARVDFVWDGSKFRQVGGLDWGGGRLPAVDNMLQINVASDQSITIDRARVVLLVTPNTNLLKTINHNHTPGARIVVVVNSASADPRWQEWSDGGNIGLPRQAQRMRQPHRSAVTLVLTSLQGWRVEAAPPGTVLANAQGYAASFAPDWYGGDLELGDLAGNLTMAAPTLTPMKGMEWCVLLKQDATGGRSVTWASVYKGATLTGAGTAGQRALVRWRWDGSSAVQLSSSGWY